LNEKTRKKKIEKLVINLIVWSATAWFMFPILWQVLSSIKPPIEVTASPPAWIFTPSSESWYNFFVTKRGASHLLNSIIVTGSTTIISIALGSLAAYGLSRFKFKGRDSLSMDFLSFRMFPPIVVAIPLFILFQSVGLKNTYLGLVLAHTTFNLPYAVWLLRGFFMELSPEIEGASLVDGCSRLSFFWRILLPLSTPGIVTATIFCYILSWNEFMFASLLSSQQTSTLPVFSASLLEHYQMDWGLFSVACVVTAVPAIILMLFLEKYVIRGLTYGAIKG